jgi:hypothetical protein
VWTKAQLAGFARDGYLVARDAVPADLRSVALARIDTLLAERPPPPGHTGHHFYWEPVSDEPELLALLTESPAWTLATTLTAPRPLLVPSQVQVALTFPPYPHRPGGGHIDGFNPPGPDGRPGTFTMLAGVVLSDQRHDDMGNLWVWPGSHRELAGHIAAHGIDRVVTSGGHPPVDHRHGTQVHAQPGDVLFASYLLSHNIGGNTSGIVRRTVYFRLKVDSHDQTWQDFLRDKPHDFDAVRTAVR